MNLSLFKTLLHNDSGFRKESARSPVQESNKFLSLLDFTNRNLQTES